MKGRQDLKDFIKNHRLLIVFSMIAFLLLDLFFVLMLITNDTYDQLNVVDMILLPLCATSALITMLSVVVTIPSVLFILMLRMAENYVPKYLTDYYVEDLENGYFGESPEFNGNELSS